MPQSNILYLYVDIPQEVIHHFEGFQKQIKVQAASDETVEFSAMSPTWN